MSATRILSKNKELICRLSCYDIGEVFQEKTNKKISKDNKKYADNVIKFKPTKRQKPIGHE